MMSEEGAEHGLDRRYPRVRVDALFDGIFAVSMTLLVLDIRLPGNFAPSDDAQLLDALLGLWSKVMPYLVSFYVLGVRWLASIQIRTRVEYYSHAYIRWWLCYLMFITAIPFSTTVVGQYASYAPAIWLYAGNTALIALFAWRLLTLTPELESETHRRQRAFGLAVLLISALLCIALSFVSPKYSLWALVLNGLAPWLSRRFAAAP
jgi:uncharacterized membrane protein